MIYTILDADGFVVRDLDGPEGAIDHVPRPDGGSVVSGESEAAGAARIATARRNARDSIDTAAGMARARYITIAPGQDATYAANTPTQPPTPQQAIRPTPATTRGLRPRPADRADARCSGISHQNNGRFFGPGQGSADRGHRRQGALRQGMKQRSRSTRTARKWSINSILCNRWRAISKLDFPPRPVGLRPTFPTHFLALCGSESFCRRRPAKQNMRLRRSFWEYAVGGGGMKQSAARAEKARLRGDRWGCVKSSSR